MAKASKEKELPPGVPPEGLKPPPHGTPRKLDANDVAGDLPRVVNQLDRVPVGSKARRWKCRVLNHDGFRKTLYVLAVSAEDAKKCHVEAVGLTQYIATLKRAGVKDAEIPEPQVLAQELPD